MVPDAIDGTMPTSEHAVKHFYELIVTALRGDVVGNGTDRGAAEGSSAAAAYSVQQVESVASFFSKTVAQHVKGYQYVCHEVQPEVVEVRSIPTQTPLEPCPLNQAIEPDPPAVEAEADTQAPGAPDDAHAKK